MFCLNRSYTMVENFPRRTGLGSWSIGTGVSGRTRIICLWAGNKAKVPAGCEPSPVLQYFVVGETYTHTVSLFLSECLKRARVDHGRVFLPKNCEGKMVGHSAPLHDTSDTPYRITDQDPSPPKIVAGEWAARNSKPCAHPALSRL
ncbi:hypothetical protein RvY_19306 [Ramazzottius varieornatus]|uniref:Uncharacterized protein n=1 Tax=Ramazzottius varieornatus TaxID=947166 RepID=A0A1D1W8Z0_RAMVA|nr:hypothetical protein RvY_19306 [Ramazzottius varieornatus]